MELRLHHIIDHLYNIFLENDGSENCAQLIEEELYKMFDKKSSLNDEHDFNVVGMNSLNGDDANDMQSHMLGDAIFEDLIFRPSSFDEKIYYDESMPPIYDDYIDESGFGEVMTLFNDDSTILEEVSIDFDNKVAIYDDYGDDMYAIKSNDNHETFHHDFNAQTDYASHDSYFVEFAPTTFHENKIAYVGSNKNSMLVDHEKYFM